MKDVMRYAFYSVGLVFIVPLLPVIVLAELVSRGALSRHTFGRSVSIQA